LSQGRINEPDINTSGPNRVGYRLDAGRNNAKKIGTVSEPPTSNQNMTKKTAARGHTKDPRLLEQEIPNRD